ncbi:hypothetical protein TB2_013255 [Malus domestica]
MTDVILHYWNDYTHAVLVCVALALFSMYKLENIFVSTILSFATTEITCMSYWFNPKVSFADNQIWVPHLLYIRLLGYPRFVEADQLRSALRDQILFQDDISYMTLGISITFLDVSNFIVLKIPMELAVVSNESHSVSCPTFFGFGPLNSLLFTLLNESWQLEHNRTVETCGTNPLALFTDSISTPSWIMAATRHFLIGHHSVIFLYSTNGLPSSPILPGLLVPWVYCLAKIGYITCLLDLWSIWRFTPLVLEAFIMLIFLEPQGLGEQAAQVSTYQLDGMRKCLILRGREC